MTKERYCKANLELAIDLLRKAKTQTSDKGVQYLLHQMIVAGERAWQILTPSPEASK